MRDVTIIGSGFAGLSAAVFLSEIGVRVTLIERRKHLGGRAYSFTDQESGDTIDNGQHLFMACYWATKNFLGKIGTLDQLHFQDHFHIDFLHPFRGKSTLAFSPKLIKPLHLIDGFLRFDPIVKPDLLRLLRIALSLYSPPKDNPTVETWLRRCGQSSQIRKFFWDPLCISALNSTPSSASACHLISVLREAFLGKHNCANLGFSRVGLNSLYINAARRYIEARGGDFKIGLGVSRLETTPNGPVQIRLNSGDKFLTKACICTVPPTVLAQILSPLQFSNVIQSLSQFRPSPILSVNLWFDRPIIKTEFLGLLGTKMHWVFNKASLYKGCDQATEGHITIVTSAADALINSSKKDLVRIALRELRATIPGSQKAHLKHYLIVRERQATFPLPANHTPIPFHTLKPGLFLAGDWTNLELPATVESAIRSGYQAAENTIHYLKTVSK